MLEQTRTLQAILYIKREQRKLEHSEKFEESRKRLNLQLNCEGICECRGSPIYLPSSSALSEKIIASAHRNTLHGGVASTMEAVRSLLLIPVLKKLTKSVIRNCYVCKRFRAMHYPNHKSGLLPRYRTEQALPFEIVGTDYAGLLYYKSKGKKDLEACILSFSCSVSRVVHLELLSNLTTTEFIKSFKKLISRRRKPNIIYPDNAETFKAGAKWFNSINRDVKFRDFFE